MKSTCRTCNHFRPHPDPMVDAGTCHFHAPRPVQIMVGAVNDYPDNVTEWPTVHNDDRCGQYIASLQELPRLPDLLPPSYKLSHG